MELNRERVADEAIWKKFGFKSRRSVLLESRILETNECLKQMPFEPTNVFACFCIKDVSTADALVSWKEQASECREEYSLLDGHCRWCVYNCEKWMTQHNTKMHYYSTKIAGWTWPFGKAKMKSVECREKKEILIRSFIQFSKTTGLGKKLTKIKSKKCIF